MKLYAVLLSFSLVCNWDSHREKTGFRVLGEKRCSHCYFLKNDSSFLFCPSHTFIQWLPHKNKSSPLCPTKLLSPECYLYSLVSIHKLIAVCSFIPVVHMILWVYWLSNSYSGVSEHENWLCHPVLNISVVFRAFQSNDMNMTALSQGAGNLGGISCCSTSH